MLYLITGGSGSGKSEYAENLAVGCKGDLYYFATMSSKDEESRKRIKRHRMQRAGKGFTTVECPVALEQNTVGEKDVILLEDLSNLLANEMYLEAGRIKIRSGEEAFNQMEQAVLNPLLQLEKQAACVIIVTNEIFSDGAGYDEETTLYLRLLGTLNQRLAQAADGVVEVVCGIPLWQKG